MHIVTPAECPTDLVPLDRRWEGQAANDAGVVLRRGSDFNLLVASIVGQVTVRVRPRRVNVELSLATGRPIIKGDTAGLAFAIAGVLGAQLRNLEEADGGDLRVETQINAQAVSVVISSSELPSLQCVRAIEGDNRAETDPTLAHCRRLVESLGGSIELADDRGLIGFRITVPSLTRCHPLRIVPDEEHAASEFPVAA